MSVSVSVCLFIFFQLLRYCCCCCCCRCCECRGRAFSLFQITAILVFYFCSWSARWLPRKNIFFLSDSYDCFGFAVWNRIFVIVLAQNFSTLVFGAGVRLYQLKTMGITIFIFRAHAFICFFPFMTMKIHVNFTFLPATLSLSHFRVSVRMFLIALFQF